MNLTVLGTGTADGWPTPRCSCSSCTTARLSGSLRGPTSALLDGALLLDCGPETPYAAQHAGVDLTGLRHVLLTRAVPRTAWHLLRDRAVDVLGSPRVVVQLRAEGFPDARVLGPGDRLTLGAYQVRGLAGSHDGVVYDVAGPSGRLLHAPTTGPLPGSTVEALRGAAFHLVLLDETGGDQLDPGTATLDLRSFPEQLLRLRGVGAVTDSTDVVAVHLSHRNPPAPELSRRLAAWGARVVEDGTTLGPRPPAPTALRTLLIGGARSGKSAAAEGLLAAEPEVTYVATAYPADHDGEWAERVALHRSRRPAHWATVESLDLVSLLESEGGPLLVDCLTLWLTRVMDRHGAWDDATWTATGQGAVQAETDALVEAWGTTGRRVVAVTNEVGQGVVPDTAAGRRFRDQMGRVNAAVAARTEDVLWCVAGRVTRL